MEFSILPVWQQQQHYPAIVEDAKTLWNRLGALPQGVSAEERANQLCAVAYCDGEMLGVSTVHMGTLPSLPRCRLGFLRVLVAPEHQLRGVGLARTMSVSSRDVLEQWSRDNPGERLLGMAAIIESPDLAEESKRLFWPENGLALVGYTAGGRQIRIVWFAHARLE